MLRTLIAFIHVIALSFIFATDVSELKKEDFKVETTAPNSIEKGTEAIVELKFTVGNVKGFAKLTDNFPSGVLIEAVDMGNATFTFNNGVLKIIWLNFPTEKEFAVKYKVKVDQSAPSNFEIGGKFSYLENNEKRSYSVFKKSISTGSEDIIAKNEAQEVEETVEAYAKIIRSVESLGDDQYKVTLSVTKQGIEGFCKIQEFTSFGGKMTEGELNGAIFSFIKNKGKFVWMALPPEENFTVSYNLNLKAAKDKNVETLRGDFSFLEGNVTKKVDIINEGEEALAANTSEENTNTSNSNGATTENESSQNTSTDVVKVPETKVENPAIATNITKDSDVEKVSNEDEELAQNETIENKEDVKQVEELEVESNTEVENKEENETPELVEVTEEIAEEIPVMVDKVEESTEPEEESSTQESKTQAPEPNTTTTASNEIDPSPIKEQQPVIDNSFGVKSGVRYRVQIAAGKNVVDKAYFEKRHNWTNEFVIENHQGWVKYTTGSYQVYKDARDNRENVNAGNHKFDGPFVTAYNENIRITVQEALMISKQKWYK